MVSRTAAEWRSISVELGEPAPILPKSATFRPEDFAVQSGFWASMRQGSAEMVGLFDDGAQPAETAASLRELLAERR
jgi:hypothetical protein